MTMNRRPGFTVVEVLVALFILAIGVIAIQTMFPLAASQHGLAVRSDRSALGAFSADGYFRSYWKAEVVEKGGGTEPFFTSLDNPDGSTQAPHSLPNASADPVSYPVIIDPMGFVARGSVPAAYRDWFGDFGGTNIPRRTLNAVFFQPAAAQSAFSLRICSLMDGLGYDEFGSPVDANGLADRELRYNWLWIIQRTNNLNKLTANLTVVTFDRRAHMYAPPGSEAVFNNVAFDPNPLSPNNTRVVADGRDRAEHPGRDPARQPVPGGAGRRLGRGHDGRGPGDADPADGRRQRHVPRDGDRPPRGVRGVHPADAEPRPVTPGAATRPTAGILTSPDEGSP